MEKFNAGLGPHCCAAAAALDGAIQPNRSTRPPLIGCTAGDKCSCTVVQAPPWHWFTTRLHEGQRLWSYAQQLLDQGGVLWQLKPTHYRPQKAGAEVWFTFGEGCSFAVRAEIDEDGEDWPAGRKDLTTCKKLDVLQLDPEQRVPLSGPDVTIHRA
jgi:hypothetical protein